MDWLTALDEMIRPELKLSFTGEGLKLKEDKLPDSPLIRIKKEGPLLAFNFEDTRSTLGLFRPETEKVNKMCDCILFYPR